MAIYHFSAKVMSRASGSSAVAAAAYRSASRLRDERLDRDHDFSNKSGVVHSEVLLPGNAPEAWHDRERLWNDVEAAEKRKDAQLAREVEFAIPQEMTQAEGVALARDFVTREFVARGMVADLNVHWDIGADGSPRPHAHVMLGLREVTSEGFGAKVRDWNRTDLLTHWREAWAGHVNARLAQLDIEARIDHRSLEAQGIDLEPQHKIGPAAGRMAGEGLESERLEEHHAIAKANGEKILAHPAIALEAITHQQATFTTRDLAKFVHRHSEGKDQFDQVMAVIKAAPELVALGKDGRGEHRFTSRAMLETEQRLTKATVRLDAVRRHGVPEQHIERAITRAETRGLALSPEQRGALEHVTGARGLASVIGYAGTGKSVMLGVARDAWEQGGYEVRGIALSGIAAESLESGSGIASRTIAGLEHQWGQGRELLSDRSVLVIDEAGMIGTRQMERVLAEAERRQAKVVLVGDPQQLQAIEAGAAFRSIAERHGAIEITQVRRQVEDWQREATRQLATGRTGEALAAYEDAGHVHAAPTREIAREQLIDRWDSERQASPDTSRIILTHTNDEVQALNEAARARLREAGELGEDVAVQVERGARDFATGDRVMFLKNERSLGVKNGTSGTVRSVDATRMAVTLDDGRAVAFDFRDYDRIDHGYAATIHKAQGMTVDRVHVLATPGLDRHGAYVALTRHRDGVDLHYGQDDFADHARLARALGRDRGKDMAADYARAPQQAPETTPPDRERQPLEQAPRDRFAGLRLPGGPVIALGEVSPGEAPDTAAPRKGRFDGLKLTIPDSLRPAPKQAPALTPEPPPSPSPALSPQLSAEERAEARELQLREERTEALKRHARAVAAIFETREAGDRASPEQWSELRAARTHFEAVRPFGAQDAEKAYVKNPELAHEAAQGQLRRAVRALQLETEVRTAPALRADRFVSDWNALKAKSQQQYVAGQMTAHRETRAAMADLAHSLHRDPQLESLLVQRRQQLGLTSTAGRSLGADLAASLGLGRDRGRGRGLGL